MEFEVNRDDKLLKVRDVARILGLSEQTIRKWISDGKLKAHRIGGRSLRVSNRELDGCFGVRGSSNGKD